VYMTIREDIKSRSFREDMQGQIVRHVSMPEH